MDIDAASFWKRVNGMIKAKATKQEAVAAECGISYQTFRGWVSRKTFPGADDAFRIAQALGTTVEYLVSGKRPEEFTAEEAWNQIRTIVKKYEEKSL